jgi:hypothetical protein
MGDKTMTAQVKPYSTYSILKNKIELLDTGNVKPYDVDWIIFSNPKSQKTLIFKNNPIESSDQYVFNIDSLLYEIE